MFLQKYLDENWLKFISSEINLDALQTLINSVERCYEQSVVFPEKQKVFAAFNSCNWHNVKIVILGQDPYHGPNQANGLAFSVNSNVSLPPSLKNIFKELVEDIGCQYPTDGNLKPWVNQGVLLLNTTLTVEANKANSHANLGWNLLTDATINLLSKNLNHIVFILWGSHAQSKLKLIDSRHTILKAPHPSPLSVYRGFWGSKPFSKANSALLKHGQMPIKWELK